MSHGEQNEMKNCCCQREWQFLRTSSMDIRSQISPRILCNVTLLDISYFLDPRVVGFSVQSFIGASTPFSIGEAVLTYFLGFAEWGELDIHLKPSSAAVGEHWIEALKRDAANPDLKNLINWTALRIFVEHLEHTRFDSDKLFSQEKPSSLSKSTRQHFSTPSLFSSLKRFSVETWFWL